MDENLLEQKIEELIEQKAEKIQNGEEADSQLGKLIEKKIEQKIGKKDSSKSLPKKTTRRGFMKMLGLGAGGLAFTSLGSSASLLSGTTIGGNTAWHVGNDGGGSGLNADLVDGYDIQKNGSDGSGIINFKT